MRTLKNLPLGMLASRRELVDFRNCHPAGIAKRRMRVSKCGIHKIQPSSVTCGDTFPQGKVLVRAHTDRNLRPQPISHFSFLISNSQSLISHSIIPHLVSFCNTFLLFCEIPVSDLGEKYKRCGENLLIFYGYYRLFQNTAHALTQSAKCGIICSQQNKAIAFITFKRL